MSIHVPEKRSWRINRMNFVRHVKHRNESLKAAWKDTRPQWTLETQFEAAAEVEPQQSTVDEPEPEDNDPFDRDDAQDDPYHLGMLHGWDASGSEDSAARAAKVKDAVHELEWD
eukprot:3375791-Amphidinium_carterae.1